MALTHTTAIRNGIADYVVDAIDGGTGSGTLEFQTSGNVEVATLTFSATAFGAAGSGTATAATITDDTNATGGTVAKFVIKDGDGTEIFQGTAGDVGTEDIVLSSASIGAGDTVSCSSLTYSAPA
jgi:hypothetical protein